MGFHYRYEEWKAFAPAWVRIRMGRGIKARRSVVEAARELEEWNWLDAIGRVRDSWTAGDRKGVKFWREVLVYMAYFRSCAERGKKPQVQIIDD